MLNYTQQDTLTATIDWLLSEGFELNLLSNGEKRNIKDGRGVTDRNAAVEHISNGGNIGLLPGVNHVVIDVDRKNGKDGKAAYESLNMPETFTVKTPNNGFHFYFRKPARSLILQNLKTHPGIDFLDGPRNVVAPGSVVSGKEYRVVQDVPIADCPPEFLGLFEERAGGGDSNLERLGQDRTTEIMSQLRNENCPYDDWLAVVMALHYESEGADWGLQIAIEWTRQREGTTDAHIDELAKKWAGFDSGRATPRTGATLVKRLQAQPPSFKEILGEEVDNAPELTLIPTLDAPPGRIPQAKDGDALLPGIAGKLEAWIDSCASFKNRTLCRITALQCLSLLVDNRAVVGSSHVGMNLFSMVVMPSGGGKESARQALFKIAEEFMPPIEVNEKPQTSTIERIASGAGLANMLSRRQNRLWIKDEFGLFLIGTTKPGNDADVMNSFLSAFSNPRGIMGAAQYSKADHCTNQVEKPYLQCFSTTTPETMARAMEGSMLVEAGLINRSVPVIVERSGQRRRERQRHGLPMDIRDWITNFQKELDKHSVASPKVLDVEQVANDRLWEFQLWCDQQGILWSRAWENAMKLAGLVAIGTLQEVITDDIAAWAIESVTDGYNGFIAMNQEHCGRDRATEQQWDRVEATIRKLRGKKPHKAMLKEGSEGYQLWSKGYVTVNDLQRKLRMKIKDLDEVLENLESQHKIIIGEVENAPGRKKVRMVAVL